ncbi:MAG: hypothetical protein OXE42_03675 [Gammaproteobacteria bacterium]|nr:hypothetical protein [Gammaproteobacteria bacterium]
MSMMIAEIYEALVEAGTSEEKAKAAAGVMPVTDNLATKTDLQELRTELKSEMQELGVTTKSDIQGLRSDMNAELKVLKFAVFSLYPFVLAIAYRIFS